MKTYCMSNCLFVSMCLNADGYVIVLGEMLPNFFLDFKLNYYVTL